MDCLAAARWIVRHPGIGSSWHRVGSTVAPREPREVCAEARAGSVAVPQVVESIVAPREPREVCAEFGGVIPLQATETEMVCQPLAPLGAGGVLCEVWVLPEPSVARTLI